MIDGNTQDIIGKERRIIGRKVFDGFRSGGVNEKYPGATGSDPFTVSAIHRNRIDLFTTQEQTIRSVIVGAYNHTPKKVFRVFDCILGCRAYDRPLICAKPYSTVQVFGHTINVI